MLALGTAAVAFLAFAVQAPILAAEPVFGTASALVTVGFFVTALLLRREPGQGVTSTALIAFALLYAVGWLNWWEWGPLPLCAEVLGPVCFAFGAWALLRYPDLRLERRSERAYVASAFVWPSALQPLLALVSRPEWHRFGGGIWWPGVWPARDLYLAGHRVYEAGSVALAAGFIILVAARIARRGGVDRRITMPVAMGSATAAASVAVVAAGELLVLPPPLLTATYTVSGLLLLLIPAGFLGTMVGRRLVRAAVADLVLRVDRPVTGESVRSALREALCDPSLEVRLWLPEASVYVDGDGAPVSQPGATPNRVPVSVEATDGQPLAIVEADAALLRHRGLLDAAVAACRMALENAHLRAAVRSRFPRTAAMTGRPATAPPPGLDRLSEREREVLSLMAQGRSNVGIGQQLHLSPKTVEGHVANVFFKLDLVAAPEENRRVLAVLKWLRATAGRG